MELEKRRVDQIIRFALKEDIRTGDITSEAVVGSSQEIDAVIVSRAHGVACGMDIAERVFACVDGAVRFRPAVKDGDRLEPEQEVAFVEGNARSILRAERTALNFLGMLSGVATRTRELVDLVDGTGVKIYDTRKTVPLHRYFEKYAVKTGGGFNHRFGLWDMILIKDNHIRAFEARNKDLSPRDVIKDVIKEARAAAQKNVRIEIEVENVKECGYALEEKPDVIMLDNMSPASVRKAVEARRAMGLEKDVLFEVSGGITAKTIRKYAETGVEIISAGSITSSIEPLDLSLEVIIKK